MTHVTRGLRGDYKPNIHDFTGQKYLRSLAEKDDRNAAINRTINALREDTVTIIHERGVGSWAVPTHVVDLIRAAIERGAL